MYQIQGVWSDLLCAKYRGCGQTCCVPNTGGVVRPVVCQIQGVGSDLLYTTNMGRGQIDLLCTTYRGWGQICCVLHTGWVRPDKGWGQTGNVSHSHDNFPVLNTGQSIRSYALGMQVVCVSNL